MVPPQASEEWVEALRKHGKTFEYKTYAKEPHGFLRRGEPNGCLHQDGALPGSVLTAIG